MKLAFARARNASIPAIGSALPAAARQPLPVFPKLMMAATFRPGILATVLRNGLCLPITPTVRAILAKPRCPANLTAAGEVPYKLARRFRRFSILRVRRFASMLLPCRVAVAPYDPDYDQREPSLATRPMNPCNTHQPARPCALVPRAVGWLLALGLLLTGQSALFAQQFPEPISPSYVEENPDPPFNMVYEPVFPTDSSGAPAFDPYEGNCTELWEWQVVPSGLIWHSYMAGVKEPGFRAIYSHVKGFGPVWDVTLGGRVGLLRYGTTSTETPEGWQFDLEGACMPRLDPSQNSSPLIAVDYRFGFPLTFGSGPFHAKLGYYHLSSHLGDEWMLLNPLVPRINYVRDSVILGVGYYFWNQIRVYGEAAYAASRQGGAKPWEFQFGTEYSPITCNSPWGAPFAAINGYLREELNFGGDLTVQVGWQWRHGVSARRLRVGAQFYDGYNEQFEFFVQRERKLGVGFWYDY